MAEETLAQPLSGDEIIEAIAFKLREVLQKDCYLNAACAYESFSADIYVTVKLKDMGREPIVKAHVTEKSVNPLSEDAALIETEAHLYDKPPNEVRMQTEQPIPVLTTDQAGRQEIKHVKYDRPREKSR